ncbi:MAG TPA: EAL domain-containing protein [Actinomycetota bacterium]|jgi:EAL domain-containing protein (putative c-di-GMP-specific phosphodiesterase class I)/CheY-like chemotaxis protein|nr:EAL domain-containing protein [Actinomycetota bacterium]
MESIRVLVAEDEPQVREVLEALIATDARLRFVGAAEEAEAAIELAASVQPDVALVDVRMPGGGGVRAAREIVRRSPTTKVIAVSAFEDAETILSMLHAGARFYVSKTDPTDQILEAIHRAVDDGEQPKNEIERIVRAFDDWMDRRGDRPSLDELRKARIGEVLRPGALGVRFERVVDLSTGGVVGEEAIPVFPHDMERSPLELFADAQAVDLLTRLELTFVQAALDALDRVPHDRWISLSVSLSTAGSAELLDLLSEAPPERVVLQLTELEPVNDRERLERSITRWRASGVRIAIDDVGPGIASLRDLVRIRPDFVKLDTSVIRGIEDDLSRQRLVRALLSIAEDLGSTVIAKGADTAAAVETLVRLGSRLAQGSAVAPEPYVGEAPALETEEER